MKKKFILITLLTMLLCLIVWRAMAGVIVLVGSGVNINPASSTNFSAYAQIGTFVLSPQYLFISHSGFSNTATVTVSGQISFDTTNKFVISQTYTLTNNAATNGALFAVTNISLPVYGQISVSNSGAGPVTNFSAALQY